GVEVWHSGDHWHTLVALSRGRHRPIVFSIVEPCKTGGCPMARTIQSLERAAAVLRLLAGGERRLGLSDVAAALGLAKGTAHGILRTLQQEGFVERDQASGRYQLGAELLR